MKINNKLSLTIAIPAYNEEDNIEWVLNNTLKNLPRYTQDYEVVLVNDGRKDRTGEIAEKIAAKNSCLRVIHQQNGGYSKAMLTGINASRKKYVAYMPADGQFLVDDMRHCFEVMPRNDMVLGYRGGRQDYTIRRIIFSYTYLLILLLLFNIKYMDVGWVVIWNTKKVRSLKLNATKGIFILAETVVRFMKSGHKIAEAPSYYRPRHAGEAKNARFKVALDTFLNAFKLWLELGILKKDLK